MLFPLSLPNLYRKYHKNVLLKQKIKLIKNADGIQMPILCGSIELLEQLRHRGFHLFSFICLQSNTCYRMWPKNCSECLRQFK